MKTDNTSPLASVQPWRQWKTFPWLKLTLLIGLVALGLFLAPKSANAAACTFTSNATVIGFWSTSSTWTKTGTACGTYPGSSFAGDSVVISNGDTIILDVSPANALASLQVGQGTSGALLFDLTTAETLTVAGNVTISAGGTFESNPLGTQTGHVLSLSGNLTNNGTLDFSTDSNTAGAGIVFTGATNNTFSGSGGTTDVRSITINKGSASGNVLELNPTNFTVRGVTTDVAGYLNLSNGTFKLSGSFSGTNRVFIGNIDIPSSAGFWLNNPNYTVAAENRGGTLEGVLRISSGNFNVGTGPSDGLLYDGVDGALTIEGGTLSITGDFSEVASGINSVIFNMSGGTMTVGATTGATDPITWPFDLATTSSSFTMSGGTIIIHREGGVAGLNLGYRNAALLGSVTGGTLQIGDATSPTLQKIKITSAAPIYNLTVNGSTAAATKPTAMLDTFGLTVKNNVTIGTGTTLDANGLDLDVAGNWTDNGTWTAGTNGITTFNGTSIQTFSKSGVAAIESFCNLIIAAGAYVDTGDDMVATDISGCDGVLEQIGILKRTTPAQNINSGSPFTFTDSRNVPTTILTRTAGTLGSTSVVVVSNQSPNTGSCGNHFLNGTPILRWYNITAASGGTATVRLYYRLSNPNEKNGTTASTIRIFHCDGTTWTELGGTPGTDANGNYVELAGVTTFSPFAMAPDATPTNVDLAAFRAVLGKQNKVRVKWTTASELNLVGFNVYRSGKKDGTYKQLNAALIPTQAPGEPTGADYNYPDKKAKSGKTYFYKLQVVKFGGASEWSDIFQVRVP